MSAKRRASKPKPRYTPMDVPCNLVHTIPRDNMTRGDYWILTDGMYVTLAQQKIGEPVEAEIEIPRRIFAAFARWYVTGSAQRSDPKRGKR